MAPVICSVLKDLIEQRKLLSDPYFLLHHAEKVLGLLATSNCNGWVQVFMVAYFIPGMLRWLLFFSAIILVVTLLLHVYCIYLIFYIPLVPIGLAIRGTDLKPALLVV